MPYFCGFPCRLRSCIVLAGLRFERSASLSNELPAMGCTQNPETKKTGPGRIGLDRSYGTMATLIACVVSLVSLQRGAVGAEIKKEIRVVWHAS